MPVLLAGRVEPLGPKGIASGIAKRPLPGPWTVSSEGLLDDVQADLRHHGGPEKALHHYPFDHYAAWVEEIGAHPLLGAPGAFGENLSTTGWTEDSVCIGDTARFGTALLQVSQGRQPCFKLDLRFGRKGMARAVQLTGRAGWYWRVLEEGRAEPGDTLALVDRPRPDWPLKRLAELLYRRTDDRAELAAMAQLPELATGWRAIAERRLSTGLVEDWSSRLDG